MTCPECELNKARAALWRHEAYKQGGTPLPWDVDEVIAKLLQITKAQLLHAESLKPDPLDNMSKPNKRPLPKYE